MRAAATRGSLRERQGSGIICQEWNNAPCSRSIITNRTQHHQLEARGSTTFPALLCRSCLLIIRPRKVPSLMSICTLFRHAQTGMELWCRRQQAMFVAGVFGTENCFSACHDQSADAASNYNYILEGIFPPIDWFNCTEKGSREHGDVASAQSCIATQGALSPNTIFKSSSCGNLLPQSQPLPFSLTD